MHGTDFSGNGTDGRLLTYIRNGYSKIIRNKYSGSRNMASLNALGWNGVQSYHRKGQSNARLNGLKRSRKQTDVT